MFFFFIRHSILKNISTETQLHATSHVVFALTVMVGLCAYNFFRTQRTYNT